MRVLGIDPGKNGALAVITETGVWSWNMPATERDLYDLFNVAERPDFAILEDPPPISPGKIALVKLFRNVGLLQGMLTALAIPHELMRPQAWQKAMAIPPRKRTEKHTAFKNRLKAKAQQLFPAVPVTLANCDALLIARVAWHRHAGRER